jgi:hypothetical protein
MLHNKSVQEGLATSNFRAVVVWLGADSVKFSSHFIGQGPEFLLSSLTLLFKKSQNLRLPL